MPEQILKKALSVPVYDIADETPLERAPLLSKKLRNQIWLKREDLQSVFSFKLRGAYSRLLELSAGEKLKGIVAASAGNHAQGVALAAQKLNIKATIFMPVTTPSIKVNSVKNLGSEVVLIGDSFDDAAQAAISYSQENSATFIAPYDDEAVIAGQGTIALELLRQSKKLDIIFVPVGGGGLIAGISAVIKQVSPNTRIIGVEPEDAPSMTEALKAGKRVSLDSVGLFADGVAVKQVGKIPFRIAQICVDEMVTVTTDEICAGIKDVFEETRAIAEPAGALALAGMKKFVTEKSVSDLNIAVIVSGANMNFDRLKYVAERTEVGEKTEVLFAVTIDETPGSFKRFCEILGAKRAITEFNYRYSDDNKAVVFVGIRTEVGLAGKERLIEQLNEAKLDFIDMSDNEVAKLHLRYMIGGQAKNITNELLYRFQFPERPGALLDFLNKMSNKWNISLFHYRNHGAAYGKVLVGVQVSAVQKQSFEDYLKNLNYPFVSEQDNEGYQLFLRN